MKHQLKDLMHVLRRSVEPATRSGHSQEEIIEVIYKTDIFLKILYLILNLIALQNYE